MDPNLEPVMLFDVVMPTSGQQRIIEILTRLFAGGIILWQTVEELFTEYNKYKSSRRAIATVR